MVDQARLEVLPSSLGSRGQTVDGWAILLCLDNCGLLPRGLRGVLQACFYGDSLSNRLAMFC